MWTFMAHLSTIDRVEIINKYKGLYVMTNIYFIDIITKIALHTEVEKFL